jgi:hypothetical protein
MLVVFFDDSFATGFKRNRYSCEHNWFPDLGSALFSPHGSCDEGVRYGSYRAARGNARSPTPKQKLDLRLLSHVRSLLSRYFLLRWNEALSMTSTDFGSGQRPQCWRSWLMKSSLSVEPWNTRWKSTPAWVYAGII